MASHPTPNETDLPTQMQFRRTKRQELIDAGREPYPAEAERTHTLAMIRQDYADLGVDVKTDNQVQVAARVVFIRTGGKLVFATLQEGSGTRLQVMLSLAEVGEETLARWKADVDLGDHVCVDGRVITSMRGELSVLASDFAIISKALRPLPFLHADLNAETQVRQRYADLIVRPEAHDMVRTKSTVLHTLRNYFWRRDFVEVETPVLQRIHGGASARPFRTHMNALGQDMSLRIAMELNLKKAVVGGVDRVYEMGRVFRNEGVDSTHSPEFTMLEAYRAYADQFVVAADMEDLILEVADALGTREIETADGTLINLSAPWRRVAFYDALSALVGAPVSVETPVEEMVVHATCLGMKVDPAWSSPKVAMELMSEFVEPTLVQPTFVFDYPAIAQPLARPHRDQPGLVEAWDLFIDGMECGTGFSELIDPVIQREVLEAQSLAAAGGDEEAMELDEDFLLALEYGAPPMGGLGCGVDRLIMLFTQANIRETILFPHTRA
jgi:lysyl-tRNA synthetase, class II